MHVTLSEKETKAERAGVIAHVEEEQVWDPQVSVLLLPKKKNQ
jgi:hypothetical protein